MRINTVAITARDRGCHSYSTARVIYKWYQIKITIFYEDEVASHFEKKSEKLDTFPGTTLIEV